MDHATAQKFADGWAQAWNAHDLEGVLGHFADGVVFSSHGTYLGADSNPVGAGPS